MGFQEPSINFESCFPVTVGFEYCGKPVLVERFLRIELDQVLDETNRFIRALCLQTDHHQRSQRLLVAGLLLQNVAVTGLRLL
jgi:hypothetical protein